jgi:hypothetical protein
MWAERTELSQVKGRRVLRLGHHVQDGAFGRRGEIRGGKRRAMREEEERRLSGRRSPYGQPARLSACRPPKGMVRGAASAVARGDKCTNLVGLLADVVVLEAQVGVLGGSGFDLTGKRAAESDVSVLHDGRSVRLRLRPVAARVGVEVRPQNQARPSLSRPSAPTGARSTVRSLVRQLAQVSARPFSVSSSSSLLSLVSLLLHRS